MIKAIKKESRNYVLMQEDSHLDKEKDIIPIYKQYAHRKTKQNLRVAIEMEH